MKNADLETQYTRFPELPRGEMPKLLTWLKTQPHFPDVNEAEVLLFFHACFYSLEQTKSTLETNLTIRTNVPEFFEDYDCDLSTVQRAMETAVIVPLQQRTPAGYSVILSQITDTNAMNFNFAHIMKLYNMIYDMWLCEDGIRKGDIAVINMKGFSLGHLARLNVTLVRKFLYYMQEASAVRLIGIHFINVSPVLDKLLTLIMPFLKQEIKDILHSHSTMDTFYEHVPKVVLPADYGGPLLHSRQLAQETYAHLQEQRLEIIAHSKRWRVREDLRPAKSAQFSSSNLFGIEGNFRKLNID